MITLLHSEEANGYLIQMLVDDSEVPCTYHVLVVQDSKTISSFNSIKERVAYGIWEGYKNYYSRLNCLEK